MNVHEINLDVSKQPAVTPVLHLGQGDKNGTTLQASIYDDGVPLSLSGKSARFEMRAPGDSAYYEVNGTVSGNVATFAIDETYAAAICGTTDTAYVEVLQGTTVICSTNRFRIVVLPSAQEGVDPTHAWTNGVEEFLEDAQGQIDAAVEQAEDAAADALEAAEEAREAAGGTIPLMSPIQRGGAKLGHGLNMDGETLNLGPLTDSGNGANVQTDGCGIFGVSGEGWSEQDTTTGKNLLPNNLVDTTVSGVTFTKLPDGGIRVHGTETGPNSGTGIAQNLTLEPGTYTVSMGGQLLGNLRFTVYSHLTHTVYVQSAYGTRTITLQSQDTVDVYFTSSGSNYQLEDTVIYPQIEAGSTATSYEPYTGGKASPSPDYPQEIRVARGRNLLDIQTSYYSDHFALSNNTLTNTQTDTRTVFHLYIGSVVNGTIASYKVVGNLSTGAKVVEFTPAADGDELRIWHSGGSKNLILFRQLISVKAGTAYVASFDLVGNNTSTVGGLVVSNIQIELGTQATPYVPYGHIGLDVTANGQTTTTPIPLPSKGFAGSVSNDTKDALKINSAGRYRWDCRTWMNTYNGGSGELWELDGGGKSVDIALTPYALNAAGADSYVVDLLCTHFLKGKTSEVRYATASGCSINSSGKWMYFSDATGTMTLSNWKAAIQANPITVIYPLATPTTEQGYINLPDLPEGATVSIPELESIDVEWWVEGAEAMAEHGRDTSKAAHELSEKLSTLEAAVATLATS